MAKIAEYHPSKADARLEHHDESECQIGTDIEAVHHLLRGTADERLSVERQ